MDTETWIALVGVALTATGLALPTIHLHVPLPVVETSNRPANIVFQLNVMTKTGRVQPGACDEVLPPLLYRVTPSA